MCGIKAMKKAVIGVAAIIIAAAGAALTLNSTSFLASAEEAVIVPEESTESSENAEEETTENDAEAPVVALIENCYITIDAANCIYDGAEKTPEVSVLYQGNAVSKADYTVEYSDNVNAGTATAVITGTGGFYGSVTKSFEIAPRRSELIEAILLQSSFEYDGKEHVPAVSVKSGDKELVEGTDFTVSVSHDTTGIGDKNMTVTYLGNYEGKSSLKYGIVPCDIKSAVITGIKNKAYTGKALTQDLKVTYGDQTLTEGEDYTVKYIDNVNTGQAKVTITGIGSYTGAVSKTFIIVPKKQVMSSFTSSMNGKAVAKWEKDAMADGYQLQYTTSTTYEESASAYIDINKNSTVSKEITGLKCGTKYYVHVRAYKIVDGKKYYGTWSYSKKVVVKNYKGWQEINDKFYYFNDDGTMAKNTYVDYYKIEKDGTLGKKAADLKRKVQSVVAVQTKNCTTSSEKLKACFDYTVNSNSYKRYNSFSKYEGWEMDYAYEMITNHQGNCYRFAAEFMFLARELGYDAKIVTGLVTARAGGFLPHGWCEINQKGTIYVCDPDLKYETGNSKYYMTTYGNIGTTYIKS